MYKLLISYYQKYKYIYFVAIVFATVSVILRNITPFIVKGVTDSATSQNYENILTFIVVLGVSLIISNLTGNLSSYIQDKTLTKVSVETQRDIFKKIHDLDFGFYLEKSSGALISILKRGDSALYGVYFGIHDHMFNLIVAFTFLLISFSFINFKYVLLAIAIFGVMILSAYKLVKKNLNERTLFNDKEDELSAIKVDNMINFETVKYFGNENFELTKFTSKLSEWFDQLMRFFTSFRYIDLLLGNIANIGLLIFFYVGYKDFVEDKITLGTYLFISSFALSIFPHFWQIIRAFREIAKNQIDLKKYIEILKYEPEVKDPENSREIKGNKFKISFNNITFKYKNGDQALKNFNLDITEGESVALVGYSGAGKTTVVKLLLRLFNLDKGNIFINDIDISSVKKSDLRKLIGVVPQEPLLFNDTIKYNITYGKQNATDKEIIQAAKQAQVHDFISNLPQKYDTVVGERGLKLSGGQKQRLAIARVILKNSKIVIFDEATSNLDSQSEKLIQEAFWKLAKDKTTIIIAHRLSTIMHADRIIVIDSGKVVESGTHDKLIKLENGLYKKLWNLQHNGFIGG